MKSRLFCFMLLIPSFHVSVWCGTASILKDSVLEQRKLSSMYSVFISDVLTLTKYDSDSYNPVPGVMAGVPSSRNYDGGFSSKLMVRMDISYICHIFNCSRYELATL